MYSKVEPAPGGTERYSSAAEAPLFSVQQQYCLAQPKQSSLESMMLLGGIDPWARLGMSIPFLLGAVRAIIILALLQCLHCNCTQTGEAASGAVP